jgi:hypothetical protein
VFRRRDISADLHRRLVLPELQKLTIEH